jgi:cobalt-zinc-cadmium efflux system outer membrane protein
MSSRTALIALSCLLAASTGLAQTPPEKVSLASVLSLARGSSPRLALDRQEIAIAEAERRTAGAYPNPTLLYGRQRPGSGNPQFDGKSQQDVAVELPLLIGGQRGARVEAAERRIDATKARAGASANELAAEAGAAHIALLAAQERKMVLNTSLDELSRMRDIVAGRQTSGMASQYDLLRVDVELEAWRTRAAEADAEFVDRQVQLAALLGFPAWRPVAVGELKPLDVVPTRPATENPSLVAAQKEAAAAQALTDVARRERFPAVSLNAGRTWTSEPFGLPNVLGLAVEVPILDTRAGAFDKARAEAHSATLRVQLAEARVRADQVRYQALVERRSAALEQFRERMVGRLPALKQMAEDAYRLGRGSIIELLDATRTRYVTQLGQIELISGLMEAQLRFQASRGEFVAP